MVRNGSWGGGSSLYLRPGFLQQHQGDMENQAPHCTRPDPLGAAFSMRVSVQQKGPVATFRWQAEGFPRGHSCGTRRPPPSKREIEFADLIIKDKLYTVAVFPPTGWGSPNGSGFGVVSFF